MIPDWAAQALDEGERVLASDKPSLHGLWAPLVAALGMAGIGLLLEPRLGLVTILLAGGPVYRLLLVARQARGSILLVTDKRLLLVTRALGRQARSIPLHHVTRTNIKRLFIGRLTGVWTLRASTSNERASDARDENETSLVVYGLRNAPAIHHTMTTRAPGSVAA